MVHIDLVVGMAARQAYGPHLRGDDHPAREIRADTMLQGWRGAAASMRAGVGAATKGLDKYGLYSPFKVRFGEFTLGDV